jgi:superoxide dismutase, Cu-Zn family
MQIRKWIFGFAILFVAALPAAAQSAHADIMNASGQKIGEAKFHQTKEGVSISVNVSQIPPGDHGIHIHATGQCVAPDFKTAGAHFNPDNKQHGAKNPAGMHNGDLGNIMANAEGKAKATFVDSHVTLGDGPTSLFPTGGTSIMIHAQPDDETTDPSGNSGGRFACGVIQK